METIEKFGGKTKPSNVFDTIKEKMNSEFTKKDLETLPSNRDLRWRNTVNRAVRKLKKDGCLSSESPKGVWEITWKGRKYIREHQKNADFSIVIQ